MRRLILYSALALVVGAGVLRLLQHDPGYVLIAINGTTIEMRFWFAVLLLLLGYFAFWFCKRALVNLWRAGSGTWKGAVTSRNRRAEMRTRRGLINFIEGNWKQARHDLLRAAKRSDLPLIHYLAAARSAYELGDTENARQLLSRAEEVAPDNELAIALSQARMQLMDKKYEPCLATLHRAKTLSPEHPVVLDLLRQVYEALRDWGALEFLLPELAHNQVLSNQEWEALRETVFFEQLRDQGRKLNSVTATSSPEDRQKNLDELYQLWQRTPKVLKGSPKFIAFYCGVLMSCGEHAQAEPIIRAALKLDWYEPLVELYGLVEGPDPQKQLRHAESWLKSHPEDATLMLALGRLSLRNEIWGQAKDYFLQSLQLKASPAAYAEVARLYAYLGEHEESTRYYQQGLLLTTNGLPNLPLPKASLTS